MCRCMVHRAAVSEECSRTQPGGRKGQAPFVVKSEKPGPGCPWWWGVCLVGLCLMKTLVLSQQMHHTCTHIHTHITLANARDYCSRGKILSRLRFHLLKTQMLSYLRAGRLTRFDKGADSLFKAPQCLCKFPFLLLPSQNSGCANQWHPGLTSECLV